MSLLYRPPSSSWPTFDSPVRAPHRIKQDLQTVPDVPPVASDRMPARLQPAQAIPLPKRASAEAQSLGHPADTWALAELGQLLPYALILTRQHCARAGCSRRGVQRFAPVSLRNGVDLGSYGSGPASLHLWRPIQLYAHEDASRPWLSSIAPTGLDNTRPKCQVPPRTPPINPSGQKVHPLL